MNNSVDITVTDEDANACALQYECKWPMTSSDCSLIVSLDQIWTTRQTSSK